MVEIPKNIIKRKEKRTKKKKDAREKLLVKRTGKKTNNEVV